MATETYHNGIRSLMEIFKNSQSQLIVNICMELGCPDKSEELILKFVDKKIKLKKFKDKNAPKGASTGYQIFCNERRQVIKQEKPDISFRDLMQRLSKEWKETDNKSAYLQKSEEDKERFMIENEKYKTELYSSTLSNVVEN
jgi:hypothetical protein